jgi:ubiquitin conjugation factor E4 B
MRYIIAWLLRLIQPESDYPKRQINLPLGEDQPLVFRCLPEYLLEDIVDNFKFVTQHMPDVISVSQCEELVTIAIAFLRNSEYVRNPYLKSGLVSILFHGVWRLPNKPKGILGDLLTGMTFCQKHLLHALMKFYIEAESTGGHNQFYDKFNIRYEIFQVIRCIWSNPVYRENLAKESKVNPDFFVRFVNLLLNDVTYVLGEGFRALNKIHDLQLLLEDPNNGLDETQKQEKQEALEDQERMAKANIQLTNETVSMLKLFTDALAEAFTSPEIVQRLADMLDYNLEAMVGDKQRNLKVKDEKKYYWNPKQLLADLIAVYVNLKDQKNFHVAVARDGRSYKDETFKRAGDIMSKTGYKSPEELAVWRKFAERIRKVKEEEDQAEEDLGEIPDEFLDPILYTLMEDPVQLPVSKIYVDRSSIRTHLLSDPHDPFNRVPLKIEDVLPAPDLVEKINNFKAQARNRKFEALKENSTEGAAVEDKMDLTE